MNKNLVLLLLLFTFLYACKDESIPETIEINLPELKFQAGAGSMDFIIKSNIPWTVESTDSWLTCTPTSGQNSRNLTAKVQENIGTADREGKLIIKMTGGSIIEEVKVFQLGVPPAISVPATAEAKPEGGEVKVLVTATAGFAWTVQIPAGSFVSEKSKTNNEIVFVATPNDTEEKRETVITFKLTGTDKEAKLTITQSAQEAEEPATIVTVLPAGTLASPSEIKYTTDAAERDWKDFIPSGHRFIMQDHVVASTTRGLHVILIKNVTDQPTGPIEFKLEGFDPNAATVRWDQNALFEGNNNTRFTINGTGGTPNPPIYLNSTGLAPGQEAFLLFRIRNTAVPQNTEGVYVSKFTVTGEGINIEGTLEMTVVPAS